MLLMRARKKTLSGAASTRLIACSRECSFSPLVCSVRGCVILWRLAYLRGSASAGVTGREIQMSRFADLAEKRACIHLHKDAAAESRTHRLVHSSAVLGRAVTCALTAPVPTYTCTYGHAGRPMPSEGRMYQSDELMQGVCALFLVAGSLLEGLDVSNVHMHGGGIRTVNGHSNVFECSKAKNNPKYEHATPEMRFGHSFTSW
jgi:hypothetical protein